jgi:glucuronoarabinoxylan endo-1,4-beta-xylanase
LSCLRSSRLSVVPVPVLLALTAAASSGCGGGPPFGTMPGDTEGAPVTVTADVTTTYQTMVGFGAAAAYYSNFLAIHPNSALLYQTLFTDLGIQVLRVANWYNNNNDNGVGMNSTVGLIQWLQAMKDPQGNPVPMPTLLMSSWNPPQSLKSNNALTDPKNATDPTNLGTLTKDASGGYDYASFAQWWADSLTAHAAKGVVPDYISLQNEPDFPATQEGACLFDPTEDATNAGYPQALAAVKSAFASLASPAMVPKLVGPELDGISGGKLQSYMNAMASANVLGDLDVAAYHLYNGGMDTMPSSFDANLTPAATAAGTLPSWMTEYAPKAQNVFYTAWLIQNALTVGGVSAYLYWDLFWVSANPPQGLVTVEDPAHPANWTTMNGFSINDDYYAVQHFAKWTGAGWTRVGASSSAQGVNASAFTSPDGTHLTLIILNTDGVNHSVTVDSGGFAGTTVNAYESVSTTGTRVQQTALAPGNTIELPSQSIVTITFGP